MSLKKLQFTLMISSLIVVAGCRSTRPCCCGVDTSIADTKVAIVNSGQGSQIGADFSAVAQQTDESSLPINSFFGGQFASLELHECACTAAINSPIADSIDKERKAICCQGVDNKCINDFLSGQALMQRNKAAAKAGELFLRLVEIGLQQRLVDQSQAKLEELRAASDFADEQGFATVAADTEIDEQLIVLKNKFADLDKAHVEVTANLNVILGNSLSEAKTIEPVFELTPVAENVDLHQEIATALATRADLTAMNKRKCGCIDKECFAALASLEPRIGLGVASTIRKCALLEKLGNQDDPARCVRNQQYQELKSAREELVRLEVTQAVLDIQAGYKKLTIENENIQRLETRMAALESASELDSLQIYMQTIEVWGQRQAAFSARVTKAIEFEIAKLKLLEATGQWTDICGLTSP